MVVNPQPRTFVTDVRVENTALDEYLSVQGKKILDGRRSRFTVANVDDEIDVAVRHCEVPILGERNRCRKSSTELKPGTF